MPSQIPSIAFSIAAAILVGCSASGPQKLPPAPEQTPKPKIDDSKLPAAKIIGIRGDPDKLTIKVGEVAIVRLIALYDVDGPEVIIPMPIFVPTPPGKISVDSVGRVTGLQKGSSALAAAARHEAELFTTSIAVTVE